MILKYRICWPNLKLKKYLNLKGLCILCSCIILYWNNMVLSSATKLVLIMIVIAIIVLNFVQIEVKEPLKTIAIMIVSFYFGKTQVPVITSQNDSLPKD